MTGEDWQGEVSYWLMDIGWNGDGDTIFILSAFFFVSLKTREITATPYFHILAQHPHGSSGSQLGIYLELISCARAVAASTNGQDFDLCYTHWCGTTSFTKVGLASKFPVGFTISFQG